jgi:hypothetical protein
MKYFSRLKNFKNPFSFSSYKNEWKLITKSKDLDKTETLAIAENLIKNNKLLESMVVLKNFENTKKKDIEVQAKIDELKKFVSDNVILRRYFIFKKYTSFLDDKNDIKRSFIYSLLLFLIVLYLGYGNPRELSRFNLI